RAAPLRCITPLRRVAALGGVAPLPLRVTATRSVRSDFRRRLSPMGRRRDRTIPILPNGATIHLLPAPRLYALRSTSRLLVIVVYSGGSRFCQANRTATYGLPANGL